MGSNGVWTMLAGRTQIHEPRRRRSCSPAVSFIEGRAPHNTTRPSPPSTPVYAAAAVPERRSVSVRNIPHVGRRAQHHPALAAADPGSNGADRRCALPERGTARPPTPPPTAPAHPRTQASDEHPYLSGTHRGQHVSFLDVPTVLAPLERRWPAMRPTPTECSAHPHAPASDEHHPTEGSAAPYLSGTHRGQQASYLGLPAVLAPRERRWPAMRPT